MKRVFLAVSLVLPFCAGCSSRPDAAHDEAPAAERLEPSSCGSAERVHACGAIRLASQPQRPDFELAAREGVRCVVDLRRPGEFAEFDERSVVESLGMEYVNVPFANAADLSDETFDRLRAMLRDSARRPMLVHCKSGNRVGAIWFAHRALDGGLSLEAALAEAKQVGLEAPALEERARQYVARHSERPREE